MNTVEMILMKLDVPERSRLVYLDLLENGEANARQIATRIGVPRSSLYDHVRPLLNLRLVVEKELEGKAVFAIHDIADLDRLLVEEMERLALVRQRFEREKKTLLGAAIANEARIKFFEGKEGVAALLKEIIWDATDEILSLWPYHEMSHVFSAEDLELFNRRRIKQNIGLKVIWSGKNIPKKHFWSGADYKVERKIADKDIQVPMGYSIYGDKVSFISSAKEQYGFIVHSREFAMLMRMQFSALWMQTK